MSRRRALIPMVALVLVGCGKFEPNGTCTRLADGKSFSAQDDIISGWQHGWLFRDTNGIAHFVGPENSEQFVCREG